MKSISELLNQLGLSNVQAVEYPNGWPLLNKIQSEGCVVVVKIDGQRQKGRYTVVISDGPLGEEYFRKDADDLNMLIKEAVNFYDNLIWSGPLSNPSPSRT